MTLSQPSTTARREVHGRMSDPSGNGIVRSRSKRRSSAIEKGGPVRALSETGKCYLSIFDLIRDHYHVVDT